VARKPKSKIEEIPAGPGRTIEVRPPEPGQPVEVVRTIEIREFPPGTIMRPRETPLFVQVRPRPVVCPFCQGEARYRFNSGGKNYYSCKRCVAPDTGDYTVFIVPRAGG
jgi:hypothetical protein